MNSTILRHALKAALAATPLLAVAAPEPAPSPSAPIWMSWAAMVPGLAYDPTQAILPRRRPGHPVPEPIREPDPQNPDAVDPAPVDAVGNFVPLPDRWRIMEALGFEFPWYDPYNQNIWKGDKPMRIPGLDGDDWFLSLLGISDTIIEPRSIPTPVGPQSSQDPGALDIFSGIDQTIFVQTFLTGIILFKGDTVFKPPEHEFRLTLAWQYNRVDVDEVRALEIDPRLGNTRDDGFVAVQELFYDKHLRDVSDRYDFDSIRIGIQPFSTDFRGFLFQDLQFGVRLFGNRHNNRMQYNLAWFRRVEKDTNSGLNDVFEGLRDDDILVANLYYQDWPRLGFISQATIVHNRNRESAFFFDENGFIARPASLGIERPREYDVTYLGYNGDGHFGRLNLTVSAYYALGRNDAVFVRRENDISAGFFAAEAGYDFDWIRTRLSLAWASGDRDPFDDESNGFDAIFENPIFAGADTSYWIRQNMPLIGGGGVALAGRNAMIPSLRSSKELGQSNFDGPGLRLLGLGADFDLTPQSRVSVNLNQLWFDDTSSLELARNQAPIRREIGTDLSVAWIWRPFMTQNAIVRLSAAALVPGQGLADLYGDDDVYYSVLANLVFTF
ncbi:MAG: hypothetical protein KatS3mg126_2081 [Lysobacteraceae bacterium]|nr:MAG: hypothetical protein KatS3mg126_2081 [Xanthomonadaceae bacterium]